MLVGTIVGGLIGTAGTAAAAPSTIRVANADLPVCAGTPGPGKVCKEVRANSNAAVVELPTDSHLLLETLDSNAKATVWTSELAGQQLDVLSQLSYRTKVLPPGNNTQQTPGINVEIKTNKPAPAPATTNLVWEPVYSGTAVQIDQWQTWTPSTTKGWWASGTGFDKPNTVGFNTFDATLADVRAALPDAEIVKIGINQGSGNTGLRAYADNLTINETTYDFEQVNPTALTIVSGTPQSAVALKPFAQPLTTRATGRVDLPAPGATVTYTVTSGSATFPGPAGTKTATATTGPDGTAVAPPLTAGLAPGPVTVTAAIPGIPAVTFTLTVTPPPGPPVADLALTVTGVPATIAQGQSFTAKVTVRNTSSFPATQVRTSLTAPSGLRITAAPGSLFTPAAVLFTAPTLAPDTEVVYMVTFRADTRGAKTIPVATSSSVRDPDPLDNTALVPVTVVR